MLLTTNQVAGLSCAGVESQTGRGGLQSGLNGGDRKEAKDNSGNADILIERNQGGDSQ